MRPRRFQYSRRKGGNPDIPAAAIYVGRPTKWGNPFPIDQRTTREQSVKSFEQYLKLMPLPKREAFLSPLRGKHLVCWCKLSDLCHADVLLKWANKSDSSTT